jgi:hypothetical protein
MGGEGELDAGLYHFCSLECSQIQRRKITETNNTLDLTCR